ncbi:heme exporter protein B [Methanohalophilus levihalophilus]|uniref:heme exporter protein CcmB n=1 Tax=Methanohalophilus levihalophilus TaxID=1431282 RepID=UPI001FDA4C6A|nr:heme exporter protein CcmB [Methanohalophilus levihalophilus]MBP2029158.1 heme exporter protein B [Methanohalophilus levihalophilus]
MVIKALHIAAKDFRIEARAKELLNSMLLFSFLVLVVFSIAFSELTASSGDVAMLAAGVLWICFVFAGTLGFSRAFASETQNGAIQALKICPVSPISIYLGKVIFTVSIMLIVEIITVILFSILFTFPVFSPLFVLIVIGGTIGFASVGVLLSALVQNIRAKEIMLPVLLLPLLVPVLIPAVSATSAVLQGDGLGAITTYLRILFVYDIVFLAVASLVFEYVIED